MSAVKLVIIGSDGTEYMLWQRPVLAGQTAERTLAELELSLETMRKLGEHVASR